MTIGFSKSKLAEIEDRKRTLHKTKVYPAPINPRDLTPAIIFTMTLMTFEQITQWSLGQEEMIVTAKIRGKWGAMSLHCQNGKIYFSITREGHGEIAPFIALYQLGLYDYTQGWSLSSQASEERFTQWYKKSQNKLSAHLS